MKVSDNFNLIIISIMILSFNMIIKSQEYDGEKNQPRKIEIILMARVDKDSVVLRWVP